MHAFSVFLARPQRQLGQAPRNQEDIRFFNLAPVMRGLRVGIFFPINMFGIT